MSGEPIRVFVVDDHEVVRLGLRAFLGATPGVELIGEAADGRAALAELDALAERAALPDVVLMDLVMPEPDGVATTALVKKAHPGVDVVVVTSFGEAHRVHGALEAGATGYVLKDADVDEIVEAIRAAHRGEVHLDAAVARVLTRSLVAPRRGVAALTARERDVLELIAQGRNNAWIARHFVLSEKTIRNHVSNIFTKLQVADRAQAIVRAREAGMGQQSTKH